MVKLGLWGLLVLSSVACWRSQSTRNTAGPEAGAVVKPVPQAQVTPEEREMLDLIDNYLVSPLGAPEDMPQQIMDFVASSSKVLVVIDQQVVPWFTERIDDRLRQRLVAAYMGGSAASQLRSGQKADDVRAGIEATVRVYAALRRRGARSVRMEKLIELDAKGELRAHIDRLVAERAAAPRR